MTILKRIKEIHMRRKFNAFWAKHPELHDIGEEEGYVEFVVCETLGYDEVKRQLKLGIY